MTHATFSPFIIAAQLFTTDDKRSIGSIVEKRKFSYKSMTAKEKSCDS